MTSTVGEHNYEKQLNFPGLTLLFFYIFCCFKIVLKKICCFSKINMKVNFINENKRGSHRSWTVLESPGIWKLPWKVLECVNYHEKSWKSSGVLHSICLLNFFFQVFYNEFLSSSFVRYFTSFFLVYLPVSRIKISKMLQLTFS